MPLREQDRAVWVGADLYIPEDDRTITTGSSGKVVEITHDGTRAMISWGSGLHTLSSIGSEVVTCQQAANRGVEPWVSVLPWGGPGERRQKPPGHEKPRGRGPSRAVTILPSLPPEVQAHIDRWRAYEEQHGE